MYVNPNFKTKAELIEALKRDAHIFVYAPGIGTVPVNGTVYLEGPHYPASHEWYAQGKMVNGKLTEVK